MRIISKFRDYYDSVQAHGIDTSLVFQRQTRRYEILEGRKEKLDTFYTNASGEEFDGRVAMSDKGMEKLCAPSRGFPCWNTEWERRIDRFKYDFQIFSVGFCGIIRPGIKIQYGTLGPYENTLRDSNAQLGFAYSLEDLDKIMQGFPKTSINAYYGKAKSKKEHRRAPDPEGRIQKLDRAQVEQFFKVHPPFEDNTVFLRYGVPIVTVRPLDGWRKISAFHTNDDLTKVEYMKAVDPFQAYQRIAQYISGVLGVGEPATVEISDDDMRDKKGFYDMSFKKDPGVKKPRRRGKSRV